MALTRRCIWCQVRLAGNDSVKYIVLWMNVHSPPKSTNSERITPSPKEIRPVFGLRDSNSNAYGSQGEVYHVHLLIYPPKPRNNIGASENITLRSYRGCARTGNSKERIVMNIWLCDVEEKIGFHCFENARLDETYTCRFGNRRDIRDLIKSLSDLQLSKTIQR